MEELDLIEPELIGREEELQKLIKSLDKAIEGKGSTVFITGEAGIGKTRLVSESIKAAECEGALIIKGWCLAESLEPLFPIKTALREAGLLHLISGEPPPLVVSVYLMNDGGVPISKHEREELGFDPMIFSSMLSAVGNFVKDAMQMVDNVERTGGLNILGYQEYKIILEELHGLHLAVVTKGAMSEFLVSDMKEVLAEVKRQYGDVLADWSGSMAEVAGIEDIVSSLVRSGKYNGEFLADDAKLKQENLFDNVLLGIQRVCVDRPLLFFLDDLQWADPSSLALLHYLTRNTRDHKVLFLGTYRPEDIVETSEGRTHQLVTTMQNMNRENLLENIELTRMGPDDTAMMIRSALGNTSFDDVFLDKIFRETGGTPYFILEVVKLLIADGSISKNDDGSWVLRTELAELNIPTKIYDVVKRRLDRLMKEQRRILDYASVVGEEFRSDLVGKVMDIDKLRLLESLNEIERSHRLIRSIEQRYVFDHAKIREVLYNGLMEELKQEYHRIVADTLAEFHKDEMDDIVNELAYHYFEAKDERAGEYLVKAGDDAKEKYANEEAIKLYTDALKFVNDESKVGIYESLGAVQVLIGKYDSAIKSHEKAIELTEDNEVKARNTRWSARVHSRKGDYDKSLELLATAKCLVEEGTAEYWKIFLGEGHSSFWKNDYDRALSIFNEAIEAPEDSAIEKVDICRALRAIGNISQNMGDDEKSLEYQQRSLAVAEEIGDDDNISAAYNNIGIVYYNSHNMDSALDYFQRSMEISEKMGDLMSVAMTTLNIGNIHYCIGEMDRAMDMYDQCLLVKKKLGNLGQMGLPYACKGFVDMAQDRPDSALENFRQALELCREAGNVPMSSYSLSLQTEAHLALGNHGEALNTAEEAMELIGDLKIKSLKGGAHRAIGMTYRDMKDHARAVEEFDKAMKIFEEDGALREQAKTNYEYAFLLKDMGETEKARERMGKSMVEYGREGVKYWELKCLKALQEM
ncbi:MAG: hypothetical protein AYK23_02315 [Candidatus Proteinoplasmatales archaeon SG8-5]|nr:MAG: hypothetical protein AYK23_02315 [Candidatus Proteinoplasmatales archaeon SG8-5]